VKVPQLILVDVIGAAVALSCAAVGVWEGLLKPNNAGQKIHDLSGELSQLEEEVEKAKAVLAAQRDAYRQRQSALGERDLLPENVPVERDLRALSDLAVRNGLEVREFSPLGTRRYPGVQEVRFALRTTGGFDNYLGFLRGFEASSSWADITFLKVDSTSLQTGEGKSGEMTVCLYSATTERPAGTAEQTQ